MDLHCKCYEPIHTVRSALQATADLCYHASVAVRHGRIIQQRRSLCAGQRCVAIRGSCVVEVGCGSGRWKEQ